MRTGRSRTLDGGRGLLWIKIGDLVPVRRTRASGGQGRSRPETCMRGLRVVAIEGLPADAEVAGSSADPAGSVEATGLEGPFDRREGFPSRVVGRPPRVRG